MQGCWEDEPAAWPLEFSTGVAYERVARGLFRCPIGRNGMTAGTSHSVMVAVGNTESLRETAQSW